MRPADIQTRENFFFYMSNLSWSVSVKTSPTLDPNHAIIRSLRVTRSLLLAIDQQRGANATKWYNCICDRRLDVCVRLAKFPKLICHHKCMIIIHRIVCIYILSFDMYRTCHIYRSVTRVYNTSTQPAFCPGQQPLFLFIPVFESGPRVRNKRFGP